MAMRLMGEQFVTGETITQALSNAHKMENKGFSYSYDMLGEAALTAEDAKPIWPLINKRLMQLERLPAVKAFMPVPAFPLNCRRYIRAIVAPNINV